MEKIKKMTSKKEVNDTRVLVKSLVCEKLGDPATSSNVLRVVRHERNTTCPSNCVRIKVISASLNFADALQIQGIYQERLSPPFIPGNEVSGTVIEVGRDVSSLDIGDTVCALTNGGAFSEEVIAPAIGTVKLSNALGFEQIESAAGLLVCGGTAYLGLIQKAGLRRGQNVLILGAGGGVGLAAVQIAKAVGAFAIAQVGSGWSQGDKVRVVESMGADVCIDSSKVKSTKELKKIVNQVAPNGIDVVFDPIGFKPALSLLKWGGQVIVVGFASGEIQSYPANLALVKNITIRGLYWGAHMEHSPKEFRESVEAVVKMFDQGDLVVHVSHTYSFEQVQEAFSVLKNRKVVGKLLLCPGPRSML
eukprot:jgi/Picsp_1/3731/NSC_06567-R1_quinone oxidoreductase-like protein 2 homolog